MTVFESLMFAVAFATLIILVLSFEQKKNNHPKPSKQTVVISF